MPTRQTKPNRSAKRRKASPKCRAPEAAFTLVELLVVMGIIVVLAAMFTVAGGYMYGEALKSRTKGTISVLAAGLEEYNTTLGTYPPTEPPNDVGPITQTMDNETYDIRNAYSLLRDTQILTEPVESRARSLYAGEDGHEDSDFVVVDGWKNALVYRFPRQADDGQFDLWSMGPDEKDSRASKSDTIDPTTADASGYNEDNIVHGEFQQ